MLAGINNLTIEMVGTEEEAAEQPTAALEMEVEEDRSRKGKEGELKDSQFPLSPITPFLALSTPVHFYLHL